MGEEAELAEPVVDRDDDDTFCHQVAWIVAITLADNECAAVDPEHHGKKVRTPLVGLSESEHVQEQAILARTRRSEGRSDLRAVRAESRRLCPSRHLSPGPSPWPRPAMWTLPAGHPDRPRRQTGLPLRRYCAGPSSMAYRPPAGDM